MFDAAPQSIRTDPALMTNLFQILGGLAMIAGLLAVQLLVLHLIARLVLIAVSFVPLIGKRHRHAQWGSLNAAGSGTRGPRRMDGRREQRAPRWLADLLQDLRFGARMLRRAPGVVMPIIPGMHSTHCCNCSVPLAFAAG